VEGATFYQLGPSFNKFTPGCAGGSHHDPDIFLLGLQILGRYSRHGEEQHVPFDIRQLRYAIAAADHGSFYRVAPALDVEQSTLSRNVLKLEWVVGVEIFERSRAGVTMTIADAQFIRSARPMVARPTSWQQQYGLRGKAAPAG